jgi:hypothetical protein
MESGGKKEYQTDYAEVWQDVVSRKHLLFSVIIGIGLGLSSYLLAYVVISRITPATSEDLMKGYALFFGAGACVVVGIICSFMFKPKRLVSEGDYHEEQILEALKDEGISVSDELSALEELPERVRAELKEVGAYSSFTQVLMKALADKEES